VPASVIIKSAILSMSFPDCVTVCEGMLNFFRCSPKIRAIDLVIIHLSNFSTARLQREEIWRAKLCVRKYIINGYISGAAIERTLLDNSKKDNVHKNCTCGRIRSSQSRKSRQKNFSPVCSSLSDQPYKSKRIYLSINDLDR
jgi:hypothetical protein